MKTTSLIGLVMVVLLFAGGRVVGGDLTNEVKVASSVDLRPNFERWQLPQKKQGARPTCSVFASVAAMEYAVARSLDRGVELSVEFANWAGNRAIDHDQDGHFFTEIIKGYELYGICRAKDMPYAAEYDAKRQPSEKALAGAREIKTLGLQFHWIRPNDGKTGLDDNHIAQIKTVLAKGWPAAAGSYHSILLVGYVDDPALEGGGKFLVRDSGGGNEQTLSYAAAKKRMNDVYWIEAPANGALP